MATAVEITLDSLENGPGILPFNLGPTKVISHYHSFIQTVNLLDVRNKLESVELQLRDLTPQLNNKTTSLYEPHIKYLQTKLDQISEQLQTFEPSRVKRGLIDGLGSVIKSISGNLDYTDAQKYDNAIAVLRRNENNLAIEVNHQMTLSKQWVSHSTNITDRIVENQASIEKVISSILESDAKHEADMTKYAHLAQLLLILEDNIDNLYSEFSRLENLLAFIKAKTIHHSLVSYGTFKDMLHRLEILYDKTKILDVSFRDYFDIIKMGYYYKGNDIMLVIRFPIVHPTNYVLYKLSLAPNSDRRILIPTYPYVAIHEGGLVYMETECPKYHYGHLCEDNISHHHGKQSTCIQHLILKQRIDASCRFTPVTLSLEAMEQLDDQHYVLSFPNLTKARLTCSEDQYKMLKGSYLAIVPKGCALQTPAFTVTNIYDQVKGRILNILNIAVKEEESYKIPVKKTLTLKTIDLSHLHSSNSKIALQEAVTISPETTETLYHTTIPIYTLLAGAALFAAAFIYVQRRRQHSMQLQAQEAQVKDSSPVVPRSLSALFSTQA